MGACCGKGATPKDPDKAPYGADTKPIKADEKDKRQAPPRPLPPVIPKEARHPDDEVLKGDEGQKNERLGGETDHTPAVPVSVSYS